jgi:hypothetical protein
MKRREFLKTSLTVSTMAGLSHVALAAPGTESVTPATREFYELRIYRLKSGANHALLHSYLEKAALPALNQQGIKPVGVFTETDSKDSPVYVLIPYASLQHLVAVTAQFKGEAASQGLEGEYLRAPKSAPAFDRIDSWLLLAFAGCPRLELPIYSREKKPRIFELRTYESHSELMALKKVEMFNSGEIDTMRQVGLAPVFYGQALVGANLPHLTYMVSAENMDAHKQHWAEFQKHPVWNKLKADPQYADTVSKITNRFLVPTAYSQI